MIEDSKPAESAASASTVSAATTGQPSSSDGPEALQAEPLATECTIDDFMKVDLRVARIVTAEEVPDALNC